MTQLTELPAVYLYIIVLLTVIMTPYNFVSLPDTGSSKIIGPPLDTSNQNSIDVKCANLDLKEVN